MENARYLKRRNEIETYFDRTALDAWKRLTSTEKVSGIRATVRAGRAEMRAAILSRFPADLNGWRILDAGCGGGGLSLELANRGANVLGVDLSAQMIEHALRGLPDVSGSGQLSLCAGDMLSLDHGSFDAVVAMDSLIHYPKAEVAGAIAGLAARVRRKMVFTLAPRTQLLAVMHLVGQLFPKSDRSPSIEPVRTDKLLRALLERPDMGGWHAGSACRVSRGFYISELQEIAR
ncbi:Mg-protoporphyrin IX methyltransferase [Roseibium hamelinense]|uniref:Magnesium protoporphyrin IX methyltransferase n=1 Tax=Roseibium hamelinense TaxID=150831 RepID=A0A562SXA7_9HYPH|nr:magnesium protoporphyrin IX methyltransferase [Roseibium hamelinense]MTI44861.1 magnesium protoporphyrin IX methyltransferase [Roseibium hamelinense]TWI85945.1 Mg-protoporphyrin IX methyltransferase [Roseibium hamelinense]